MQIFLPFPDIDRSLESLDNKRLASQRKEAYQILIANLDGQIDNRHVYNHVITRMYRPYSLFVAEYYNRSLLMYKRRGGRNERLKIISESEMLEIFSKTYTKTDNPPWIGDKRFHDSHKANLYRKSIDDINGVVCHGRTVVGSKPSSNHLRIRLADVGITSQSLAANGIDITQPYFIPDGYRMFSK